MRPCEDCGKPIKPPKYCINVCFSCSNLSVRVAKEFAKKYRAHQRELMYTSSVAGDFAPSR